MAIDLHELVEFKDLILEFARRDIKLRYRQTVLGIAWVVLQPIVAAGVLNFAFGIVAGARPRGPSYFLFTFAGLLAWNLFSMTLSKTSLSLVGNSYLISKVYFPRLILPISGTLVDAARFRRGARRAVRDAGVLRRGAWMAVLLLPVWIALVLSLALGAGLIAAALTVQYRDIQHILPILIPFMLYASPVAYDVTQIPERLSAALLSHQSAGGADRRVPRVAAAARPRCRRCHISCGRPRVALGLFVLGAAVFKRTERRFADVV